MIFIPTEIRDTWLIDIEPIDDERGFFARSFCPQEFAQRGLSFSLAQASVVLTHARGTLRGLHYQAAPWEEDKLVRCTRGSAYAVVVDLRAESPSYARWMSTDLSAGNHRSLLVPKGCAQGYQTLEDDTELHYQMSESYRPEAKRGVRYDDPALAIRWPLPVTRIARADREWPDFDTHRSRAP